MVLQFLLAPALLMPLLLQLRFSAAVVGGVDDLVVHLRDTLLDDMAAEGRGLCLGVELRALRLLGWREGLIGLFLGEGGNGSEQGTR